MTMPQPTHARIDHDGTLHLTHNGVTTTTTHPRPELAREAAIAHVTELAKNRRMPIRLSTEGAQGARVVSVFPDGSVTALPGAPTTPPPATPASEAVAAAPPAPPAPVAVPIIELAPVRQLPSRVRPPAPITPAALLPPMVQPESSRGPEHVRPAPALPRMVTAVPPQLAAPKSTPDDDFPADTVLARPAADVDEIEQTVLVRRHAPSAVLHTSQGQTLTVSGTGTLGRKPQGQGGVEFTDPARSVSKTHLRFSVTADGITITDLHSGNGTTITHAGKTSTCDPEKTYPAPRGARVDIGNEFFVVA